MQSVQSGFKLFDLPREQGIVPCHLLTHLLGALATNRSCSSIQTEEQEIIRVEIHNCLTSLFHRGPVDEFDWLGDDRREVVSLARFDALAAS